MGFPFAVDFSFSRPNPDGLRSAGVTQNGRYLWPNTSGSKGLSRAEFDSYATRGMGTFYLYEEDGAELIGGYAAGVRVARQALQIMSQQRLLMQPVFFCIDHDYSGAELTACVQGIQGAASVLGYANVGCYGGYNQLAAMRAANACGLFFQTYAWSSGRVLSGIHIYQYQNGQSIGGGTVDFCEIRAAGLAGGGATPIVEDDMGLPISFVKDAQGATIWVVGPTGYLGVKSPYHVTLLQRARVNLGGDPMLTAELDIVAWYLRQIGAVAGSPSATLTDVQIQALTDSVKQALLNTVPHEFTITGKASA